MRLTSNGSPPCRTIATAALTTTLGMLGDSPRSSAGGGWVHHHRPIKPVARGICIYITMIAGQITATGNLEDIFRDRPERGWTAAIDEKATQIPELKVILSSH